MRARYYNVSIKRFINQDVINGSITNSQSLNKFSYVQGNPIKLTDPFGLFPCISLSGIGHAVLDLLGIIPGLDFCDAINAVWYYLEGDYANAALSTVAILPMLGSMAGNGIKWGVKAGTKADKAADTIKLGSKFNGNGKGFMVSGDQTLDTVKNLHKEYAKTGEAITWSETGDFSKLGLKVAKMGNAGAAISENGPVLRHMSRGQDVAEAAPLSNATRKVASESGRYSHTQNLDGLNEVRRHLTNDVDGLDFEPNKAMMNKIEEMLSGNQELTGAYKDFYEHELTESMLMQQGHGYNEAHNMALEIHNVQPQALYSPEIVQEYSKWFNKSDFEYWGIIKK